jgi:hypothetical protein
MDPIPPIGRTDQRVQAVDLRRLTPLEREEERRRREQERKRRREAPEGPSEGPDDGRPGIDVRV